MSNNEIMIIKNKKVCIVEKHHQVLEHWANLRKEMFNSPILITLDHHTDTRVAFCNYAHNISRDKSYEAVEDLRNKLVSKIDYSKYETILEALENLRNDEHIDCAIKSKIISKVFCIQYQENRDIPVPIEINLYQKNMWTEEEIMKRLKGVDSFPIRPYSYNIPKDKIYIIGSENTTFEDAIETKNLNNKFSIINQMELGLVQNNIVTQEYILDIDLDYFHNIKSINPNDIQIFYNLIKYSSLITIAKESYWINEWRERGYETDKIYNVSYLLESLLIHIENALK